MPATQDARPSAGAGRWRFAALVGIPAISLLALIALGYRAYTEQRHRYFTQSYIRALASLAEQTEGAIDGIASALDSAVRDEGRRERLTSQEAAGGDRGHIASVPSLPYVAPRWSVAPTPSVGTASGALVSAYPDMTRQRQTGDRMHREASRVQEPLIEMADAHLQVCRRKPSQACDTGKDTSGRCWKCVEKSVSEVLRPYLTGSPLAHLDAFVVDNTGQVLFARGNSGLRLARLPTAAPAASDKATATPLAASGLPTLDEVRTSTLVREIQVDGTSYRLFSQPLRIPGAGQSTDRSWAIGVLVPLDAAADDSRRMPLAVLLGVPLLLVGTLLILPFAQLATIGGREPLSSRTVIGLAIGLLVAPAVVTLIGLSWATYGQARDRFDHELGVFAARLEAAHRHEVGAAVKTLRHFRDRRQWESAAVRRRLRTSDSNAWAWTRVAEGRRSAWVPTGCDYLTCTAVLQGAPRCTCESSSAAVMALPGGLSASPYQYRYSGFEMLVLADARGKQVEKWASGATTTARTDTAEHSAFTDVRDGRLRRIGFSDYALNVMTSPNTGQVLSILSMPIRGAAGSFAGAATMVADLTSWTDTVSPPDVDFAVVDASGRVLFHSMGRRRLYENLFAEMTGGLPLRAALEAARGDYFDVEYHGQPHRALVRPLRGSDWSLVVLRDKDALRGAFGEAALMAVGLPLLMVGAALLTLTLVRVLLGPVAVEALWPDPRATPRYWLLLLPLGLTIFWTLGVMRSRDNPLVVFATLVAAATALTGTMLTLTAGRSRTTKRWLTAAAVLVLLLLTGAWLSWRLPPIHLVCWLGAAVGYGLVLTGWEPSWLPRPGRCAPPTVRGYAAVGLLLALQLGALPTAAVFLDAVEVQLEALTRARQIRLAESAAAVDRRIAKRIDERRPNGPCAADEPRLRDWAMAGAVGFTRTAAQFPPPTPRAIDALYLPPAVRQWLREQCRHGGAPPAGGGGDEAGTARLGGEWCHLLRHALTGPLLLALPVWTEAAHDMRYRLYDAASDDTWRVSDDGAVLVADRAGAVPGAGRAIPAWDVRASPPPGVLAQLAMAALLALVLFAFWRLVGWVVVRLFSLDVWEPTAPQQGVVSGMGGYYLRPTLATLASLQRRAGQVIDLGTCDRAANLPKGPANSAQSVLVLHLEYQLDDAAWNRGKLELLEELLIRRELPVDVVSEVDVLGYFSRRLHSDADDATEESYLTAGEMARWARVLARLDKQRADLPPAPPTPLPGATDTLREECRWTPRLRGIRRAIVADRRWTALPAPVLVAHIADLADAHYRVLWAQLTDEERLVLYHLAVRGIINPRNAELARRLMRRGLLRRTPALRVMNESFRLFVSRVEDRATIRVWERAAGASAWVWLRNGVLACVVVAAVVLFVTQPESYARWVALLTALTTVGGGVAQLFGLFRAPRAAATS